MKIVSVKHENIYLLKDFIKNMGEAVKSFRYYETRSVEIIKNHLVTFLILEMESPVAYGHLDKEDNTVWLGICISPEYSGMGYGKIMMTTLIDEAKKINIEKVLLTVDKDNLTAIRLYEMFNFKKIAVENNHYKYVCSTRNLF
jgi:ribosomal protein S18 acetylase RimI-like enzyme